MLLKVSNAMCIKLPVKLSGIQEKCEILRETHELIISTCQNSSGIKRNSKYIPSQHVFRQ